MNVRVLFCEPWKRAAFVSYPMHPTYISNLVPFPCHPTNQKSEFEKHHSVSVFLPPMSTSLNYTGFSSASTFCSTGASFTLPFLLNSSINVALFPSGLVPGEIVNTLERRRLSSEFVRGGYITSEGRPSPTHHQHHSKPPNPSRQENSRMFPAPPIP